MIAGLQGLSIVSNFENSKILESLLLVISCSQDTDI